MTNTRAGDGTTGSIAPEDLRRLADNAARVDIKATEILITVALPI